MVGEDCSTDATASVVASYRAEHPDRIRVLPNDRNLGAKANFIRTLTACRAPYIAVLEGDDYWSDPDKLAVQAAFLDANPRYMGCGTLARELRGELLGRVYPESCPEDITLDHLSAVNPFFTCTVMYRRRVPPFPDWFGRLLLGDWPLHILHAVHGPLRLLPRVTGVYRIHPGGVWSPAGIVSKLEEMRLMFAFLGEALPRYGSRFADQRYEYDYLITLHTAAGGDWPKARATARRMASNLSEVGRRGVLRLAVAGSRVWFPLLYHAAAAVVRVGVP